MWQPCITHCPEFQCFAETRHEDAGGFRYCNPTRWGRLPRDAWCLPLSGQCFAGSALLAISCAQCYSLGDVGTAREPEQSKQTILVRRNYVRRNMQFPISINLQKNWKWKLSAVIHRCACRTRGDQMILGIGLLIICLKRFPNPKTPSYLSKTATIRINIYPLTDMSIASDRKSGMTGRRPNLLLIRISNPEKILTTSVWSAWPNHFIHTEQLKVNNVFK